MMCFSFLFLIVLCFIHNINYSNSAIEIDKDNVFSKTPVNSHRNTSIENNHKVSNTSDHNKRHCKHLLTKYHVKPGRSWGTMNKVKQDLWLLKRCDQYFCQPNQLEGRGIYQCIPIL